MHAYITKYMHTFLLCYTSRNLQPQDVTLGLPMSFFSIGNTSFVINWLLCQLISLHKTHQYSMAGCRWPFDYMPEPCFSAIGGLWRWRDSHFNSLWHGDVIWRHKPGSSSSHVMACCLTAPSHYLNQCWLIISEIQWKSHEGNFSSDTLAIN